MQRKSTIHLELVDKNSTVSPLSTFKLKKSKLQPSQSECLLEQMNIDKKLIQKYPMLKDTISKDERKQLRVEIKQDIQKAKNNKNYFYMRNYKYFKDGVLLPQSENIYDEKAVHSIQQNGDKIFQNAQKQNKDIFNEIKILRSQSQSGFVKGGRIDGNMKSRVINELNTHVQRQFKIDQIMQNRLDEKASKLMFGVSMERTTMSNLINDVHGGAEQNSNSHHYNSQQQVSHIIFKDKYSHLRNSIDTSSEEENNNSHNHSISLFDSHRHSQRHRESGKSIFQQQQNIQYLQNHNNILNNKNSHLQIIPIPTLIGNESPPTIKFTIQDLSKNQVNIKEILKSISPSRLSETQIYDQNCKQSPVNFTEAALPTDTQILRYRQNGKKLELINQPELVNKLSSNKLNQKKVSERNFSQLMQLQMGQTDKLYLNRDKSNKDFNHKQYNTLELTNQYSNQYFSQDNRDSFLVNQSNIQNNEMQRNKSKFSQKQFKFQHQNLHPFQTNQSTLRFQNNSNHFQNTHHFKSIQQSNPHLKNLKKLTASQISNSEVLKDLNQKKQLFITTRQSISDYLEQPHDYFQQQKNVQLQALKKKLMTNIRNQMQQQNQEKNLQQSRNAKQNNLNIANNRMYKTSDESIQNMRQNSQKFLEFYDYLRELENDQVWYQRVIKNDNTSNEDMKKIDDIADMLLLQNKEEKLKKQIVEGAVAKFMQLKRAEKDQAIQDDIQQQKLSKIKIQGLKQLHVDTSKEISTQNNQGGGSKTLTQNSKNHSPLRFKKRSFNSRQMSSNYNFGFSSNDFITQFDNEHLGSQPQSPMNNINRVIPESRMQSSNFKKIYLQKKLQDSQHTLQNQESQNQINKKLIEKITRIQQLQPEIQRQQSVVELKSAMRIIKAVVVDRDSDDEKELYKDTKLQIKRDLMFSHLNFKTQQEMNSQSSSAKKNAMRKFDFIKKSSEPIK